MQLAIIGVPYNSSGTLTGEALAPVALREAGLIDELGRQHDVTDYGDIEIDPAPAGVRDPNSGIIDPKRMVNMIAGVRSAIARAYADRRMPFVIGGDCPLLLGCLLAGRDQLGYNPALLFVDGHEDAYPPYGSLTGEAADMELGLALGLTRAEGIDGLAAELPVLDPHEVVLLGPRDRAELKSEGIESVAHRVIVLDDTELRDAGVEITTKRWLDQFQHKPGRFWFHLDLDVLSADEMPAVSYAQAGGLVWDEVRSIAGQAIHAEHLIGVDLTIYNPDLDPNRTTAAKIVEFVAEATSG